MISNTQKTRSFASREEVLDLATRSRVVPFTGASSSCVSQDINYHGSLPPTVTNWNIDSPTLYDPIRGNQVTDSENHPEWNRLRSHRSSSFLGNIGGDFSTVKTYASTPVEAHVDYYGEYRDNPGGPLVSQSTYSGPFLPWAPYNMSFPPSAASSDIELRAWGTKAIALCAPTNPTASVTTFLGEFLSEGIPESIGKSIRELKSFDPKSVAKAISKDHLNLQFGWLPILSDLQKIHSALQNAQKILDQFDRDSGRMVRRGWKFKPELSTSITEIPGTSRRPWTMRSNEVWYDQVKLPKGQIIQETKVSKTRWFSGAFTYFVPGMKPNGFTSGDIDRRIAQAQKLLGAGLTPDDVWNLLPWSWLVDWFSNIGDVFKNLDAVILYNQVLVYGYVMEHTVSTYTYTLVGPYYLYNGAVGPVPPPISLVTETKRRLMASPYGFGLTYDGLSDMQKSILGALGVTHSHR